MLYILLRSVSKDRNCISTLPPHDQPSSSAHSNWHGQNIDNAENSSNNGSWRREKAKSSRNRSNDRTRNHSRNRRNRLAI